MVVVSSILLALFGLLGFSVYRLVFDPLRHYPGPFWWTVSRLPWVLSTIKGTILVDLKQLHDRYGPIVRVGPDEVSYATPEAIKPIYQSAQELAKDPMHLPLFHNGTPGILAADHENHRRYRKLLAGNFSDSGIRVQQPMIQRHVDLLIKRLTERATAATKDMPEDISQWYNWTTFDIIGDLAFGETFGCLDRLETHSWITSIQGNVKAIPIINGIRRYGLTAVLPLLAPRRLLELRRRNARFAEDKINQRRRHAQTPRGDLWDNLIADADLETCSAEVAAKTMSREEMISNASAIVVAGSETSATLLSGCTWLLLQSPEVLRTLLAEIDGAFAAESDIDLGSVGKLGYMLAVLKETLRLYPPVPAQSNRVTHGDGVTIAGRWVPSGTSVAVQQYAACRSPANFHRPDEFLPQRWLGHAEFSEDRREVSQPFSVGPRNCIGRQLAYAEVRLILARLLWKFELQLDPVYTGGRDWLREQHVWILWDKKPLPVRLQVRSRGGGSTTSTSG